MRLLLALALAGCGYTTDTRFLDNVMDADGDGGVGERFDGPDCADDDPAIADCDADRDGFRTAEAGGDDCDDHDASVVPGTTYFADGDGDGHGDPDVTAEGCGDPPVGFTLAGDDCDDADAIVHPGAEERCDALDRDCDGDGYALSSDASVAMFEDADGDGFGDGGSFLACGVEPNVSTLRGDCDDEDSAVFPGAAEVYYDGVDQDCDPADEFDADGDGTDALDHGGADCDDADPDIFPGAEESCDGEDGDCDGLSDADDPDLSSAERLPYHLDADGDGHGGGHTDVFCPGGAPDNYLLTGDDCDDALSGVHPGAVEWCNGRDDDCNKTADNGAVDAFTVYTDADGDGYGTVARTVCALTTGTALRDGDCADGDPNAHPGAVEVCGDTVRQDCSTAHPDDCDADGYRANGPTNKDCADDPATGGSAVHPGAAEVCNGADDDCDGLLDGNDPDVTASSFPDWYLDLDGDGHGSNALVASKVCSPPAGAAAVSDDCDDLDDSVFPEAPEACDGTDDDCNGVIDDEPAAPPLVFFDADDDGRGGSIADLRCPEPGWVSDDADCDDANAAVSPDRPETCGNAVDDDCDGLADDDDPDVGEQALWYQDRDGDGVGGIDPPLSACADPSTKFDKYVAVTGDCDDLNPAVTGPSLWFPDSDGDGFGGFRGARYSCYPSGKAVWYSIAEDCNELDPTVNPGVTELCNYRDDDCDSLIDDNPNPLSPGAQVVYLDLDEDGVGTTPAGGTCFDPGPQRATETGDCDDTDPQRSPELTEQPGNGIDDDCDPGTIDCVGWQWPDDDKDGAGAIDGTPVFECEAIGSQTPTDCNDLIPGVVAGDLRYNQGDEAAIEFALSSPQCAALTLGAGTYFLDMLSPPTGSRFLIRAANPASPPQLYQRNVSGALVNLASSDVFLHLMDLRLVGTLVDTYTVEVSDSTLVVTNSILDGSSVAQGILATGGTVRFQDTSIKNTRATTGPSALTRQAPANVDLTGLTIINALGDASVEFDATGSPAIRGARVYGSAPFAVVGGTASDFPQLIDLQVYDAQSEGILVDATAPTLAQMLLIVRGGTDGVMVTGTAHSIEISESTIVGAARNAIHDASPNEPTLVTNSVLKSGQHELVSVTDARPFHSFVPRISGPFTADPAPVGIVEFVQWSDNLPATNPDVSGVEQWDLHLRGDAEAKGGLTHDECGYYRTNDPYYLDLDGNLVFDGWQKRWFTGAYVGTDDPDGDGLDNDAEFTLHRTCPVSDDTDNDGMPDDTDSAPLEP